MSVVTSNFFEDYGEFINTIVGLVIGLVIGYFFTKNVIKRNIIHGPDSQKMKTIIHRIDKKYYKFIPYPVIGPIRKNKS